MFAPILVALVVVPIVELYVIVQVGQRIGVLPTIGLLILVSVLGTWLLKREGQATWGRLQATLRSGRMPTSEVTDGALILFGGALLLTPGFLTDVMGLLLILPPTRAAVKGSARRFLGRWASRRKGAVAGRVYEARVTRSRSSETATPPPSAPSLEHRNGEDGSPGRG